MQPQNKEASIKLKSPIRLPCASEGFRGLQGGSNLLPNLALSTPVWCNYCRLSRQITYPKDVPLLTEVCFDSVDVFCGLGWFRKNYIKRRGIPRLFLCACLWMPPLFKMRWWLGLKTCPTSAPHPFLRVSVQKWCSCWDRRKRSRLFSPLGWAGDFVHLLVNFSTTMFPSSQVQASRQCRTFEEISQSVWFVRHCLEGDLFEIIIIRVNSLFTKFYLCMYLRERERRENECFHPLICPVSTHNSH